jgi:hypothetical protein
MDIRARLKKLEQTRAEQITPIVWEEACICFPLDELPELEFIAEAEIAAAVLCPLHGVRFHAIKPRLSIYRAKWLRRPKANATVDYAIVEWPSHSPQYSKAWRASFPSGLWPAEERLQFQPERTTTLILRDGTEIASGGSANEWQPAKGEAGR